MVFEGISQYLQTTAASTRLTSHFLRLTLQPETAKPTDSTLLSVSRCAPLGLYSRPAQGETALILKAAAPIPSPLKQSDLSIPTEVWLMTLPPGISQCVL